MKVSMIVESMIMLYINSIINKIRICSQYNEPGEEQVE